MKFRDLFPFLGKKAAPPITGEKFYIGWDGMGFVNYKPQNKTFLEKGYKGNSIVYSLITKIASKVASIPLNFYDLDGDSEAKAMFTRRPQKFEAKSFTNYKYKLKSMGDEVVAGNDAVMRLFAQPNPGMGYAEYTELQMIFKLLYGGAFHYANRGVVGSEILGLYPQPAEFINLKPDRTLMWPAEVRLNTGRGLVPIKPENLYIDRFPDPEIRTDGRHLFGMSPLQSALISLETDNENMKFQLFNFKMKGAGGVFVPESVEAMQALRQAGLKDEFRKELSEYIHGRESALTDKPYVNMVMKYLPLAANAEELRAIESSEATMKRIAQAYDYPLPLLTTDASAYNNVVTAEKYLVTNTIQPLLRANEAFWTWVCKENGFPNRIAVHDLSGLPELAEDFERLAKWLSATEAITLNELRAAINYDDLDFPYMNEPLVSTSRTPISAINDAELYSTDYGGNGGNAAGGSNTDMNDDEEDDIEDEA